MLVGKTIEKYQGFGSTFSAVEEMFDSARKQELVIESLPDPPQDDLEKRISKIKSSIKGYSIMKIQKLKWLNAKLKSWRMECLKL